MTTSVLLFLATCISSLFLKCGKYNWTKFKYVKSDGIKT